MKNRNAHAPDMIADTGWSVSRDDPTPPFFYPQGGGPIHRDDIEWLRDRWIEYAEDPSWPKSSRHIALLHANDLHWLLSGGRIVPATQR